MSISHTTVLQAAIRQKRILAQIDAEVVGVVFSRSGDRLAATDHAGRLHSWIVAQWQLAFSISAHDRRIQSVDYSPDGEYLATATGAVQEPIKLWRASDDSGVQIVVNDGAGILGLSFAADGRQLTGCDTAGALRSWDVPSAKLFGTVRLQKRNIESVAASADGRWLATASLPTVDIWWSAATVGRACGTPPADRKYVKSTLRWRLPPRPTLRRMDDRSSSGTLGPPVGRR